MNRAILTWAARASVLVVVAALATPVFAAGVQIAVSQNTTDRVTLQYEIASPALNTLDIDGHKYVQMTLGREALSLQAGAPELPHIARSIILPDAGTPTLRIIKADYADIEGVDVAPSKGCLLRTVNPDDVPFSLGGVYAKDAFYPATIAAVQTPYILRDYRGVVVDVNPVQYNPVRHTLRVYSDIIVEVVTSGTGGVNALSRSNWSGHVDSSFRTIYAHQFINHDQAQLRYPPVNETGDLLVICYDAWLPNIQPLVTHKNARGIATTAVGVSTIGNNSTAIKAYIQNLYNGGNLAYVLLVGDAAQVASPVASGGSSDPTYSLLAGADNYPDIVVGRFSAETAAQVDTQVQRTISYETLPAPLQDWFWKGVGIASAQGAGQGDEGEADYEHIGNIRTQLLAYGYTFIDEIYDTTGGTAAMVTAALNQGRGIINYCGHGSQTSWGSTGFSNTEVNALANQGHLPFIFSVACVNGDFAGATCFAEAWLRATHSGQPSGAVATYMSSINQSWAPPMEAEDEFDRLITVEAYGSYGALCYAGSGSMMDQYGTDGANMFNTWHIFGDPTLRVAVTCTDAGTVALDSPKYACVDTAGVLVTDCGLNLDPQVVDTATVTIASTSEAAGETLILTENGPDSGQFAGTINTSATNAPGVLLVANGDTITVTYVDADNGSGGHDVTVTTTAVVDCVGPAITDVHVTDLQPRSATVAFTANEPARGTVHYGLACGQLTNTAAGSGFGTAATVALAALQDNTTYYYAVEAVDQAGNVTVDPNCYTFTTPEVPDYFTQLFTTDNDLHNVSVKFTPNGGNDFYIGCDEAITSLPTDPAGGTVLTEGDDTNAQITVGSGQHVSLYGVNYTTMWVASNGYITFTSADTSYNEALDAHFNQPRISALFDDLNVTGSAQVSWKQLSDHIAVTWLNVPEYSTTNTNTFQIEMYFDGRIAINYLAIAATDGLAGLSAGGGVPEGFFMSDLSALGPCAAHPPTATNANVSVNINTVTNITLVAGDEGLPNPPAALTYIVTSLPAHGSLAPQGGPVITTVPSTLPGNGHIVTYTPVHNYSGADAFTFKANDGGTPPEGGDSNVATVSITIASIPQVIYSYPLDTNPGWTVQGLWAWGHPTGGGSHNFDPTNGHTGANVYGYNLSGDYPNSMAATMYLTTTAQDFTTATSVSLKFWRWLGVESSTYDHASIDVSNNGTTWTSVWAHTATTAIADTAWTQFSYDLSAVADHHNAVYVRWGMGATDGSVSYPGWNIDDVELWGILPYVPPICHGDGNCDGQVGFADIDYFVAAIPDNQAAWAALYASQHGGAQPPCEFLNNDVTGNGHVGFDDIDPFVALIPSACP